MALAMPPPGSPTGLGMSTRNAQFSDVMPLRQDVEQDQRQRHEREEHRQAAQAHDHVREQPAIVVAHQAAFSARRGGPTRGLPLPSHRPDEQPRNTLMIRVITNRTRPISISACR